jgi:serine/threonine protein kinase
VIRDITIEGNSSRVTHHGGTRDYLAPELQIQNPIIPMRSSIAAGPQVRVSVANKVKFTRKADVYAAGIVFLELVTLKVPKKLVDSWPLIDKSPDCPDSLRKCLAASLAEDPAIREPFPNLLLILKEGREEIIAIPESFYFSSRRLSRISTTQYNREQKRRTLDEADVERVKRESFVGDQRRRTLEPAETLEIQRVKRVSITIHGDEMDNGLNAGEGHRIERRSSAISHREEKEDQRAVRRLADHSEEGGQVLEDQNVMRVSTIRHEDMS